MGGHEFYERAQPSDTLIMKLSIQALCALLCICCASLVGAVDMQTITPSQLHEEITRQNQVVNGAELRGRLREAAIASQRFDLIATCFTHPGTKSWTLRDIKKLPDNDFKTKAVIAMIRAPSPFWPRDCEEANVWGRSMLDPKYVLVEPFTSIMRELLPGKSFTVDTVRYQGRRNKLANELVEAFQKRGGQISEKELQALQSIPLALNAAAEGGTNDTAYTRIPPTEMERYMKEAYKVPQWVTPVAKATEARRPPPTKPQAVTPSVPSSAGGLKMIWIVGSVVAVTLGFWLVARKNA